MLVALHMKIIYNPCLAVLFAVILYFGYSIVGGVLGTSLLGAWMADWGSFSFVPLILVSLAIACCTGMLVGFTFGLLVSSRPASWALLISVAVTVYLVFKWYPTLFWMHYFEYVSLILAFVVCSSAGFKVIKHTRTNFTRRPHFWD